MRLRAILPMLALVGAAPAPASAPAARPPARAGTCAYTTISKVTNRLADGRKRPVAGSGSAVGTANGVWGVSYDQVAAVDASRPGDRALTCLIRLPTHCPPGDRRGRWYTTTNLRTDRSWTLPDAEHMCGGA